MDSKGLQALRLKRARRVFAGIFLLPWAVLGAAAYARHAPESVRYVSAILKGARYLGREGTVLQTTTYDCGPSALKMILDYYGKRLAVADLERRLGTSSSGTTVLSIKRLAQEEGLAVDVRRLRPEELERVRLPAIAFVQGNHFVVLDSVSAEGFVVKDPAVGRLFWPRAAFFRRWHGETLLFEGQTERR